MVYIIQKTRRTKPFPAHHDNLKPCLTRDQVDVSWIEELEREPPAVTAEVAEAAIRAETPILNREIPVDPEPTRRGSRNRQPPQRLGDWYEQRD